MTSQQILQSDLLDILFEKRNKSYGAYLLRKNYDRHMLKAIGITSLLASSLFFFINSSPSKKIVEGPKTELFAHTYTVQQEKKTELPKPKMQQQAAKAPVKQENLVTNLKIVTTTTNPVATQDQLEHSTIGVGIIQGPIITGIQPPQPPSIGGMGNDIEPPKKEAELISRKPEFPGGAAAWLRFLERNLQVPEDLEAGENCTVQIRFWVDEEGTVTNFQVAKSGGGAFDNEVIRVLKKMPKWMPALQSGKPIAVSFTQPVTFRATEQ